MASVSEPSSSSTIPAMPRAEERAVDEQIRRTRRSIKWVDFASGMITLVIGVLVFLLCVSMLEHWVVPGGWNGPGRSLLFVAMLGGIAWYSWRTFWPLVSRPINPAYAAQLIERSSPSLKNSLLNFLLLRNRRQQLSQKVYQAIEQQAAQRLSEVSLDSVIDRSALVRLGYVLVAVVVACALYRVLSPKNLTSSMERVLMPWSDIAVPSRVEILDVAPGDTQIARGEQLEVSAEVFGIRDDEPVKVRYSTLDGQSVDREVTLSASAGGSRFTGRLPDRFSAGENSGGVQQDLEYWIEAGDAKSPKYKVTVFARPTLVVEKIRYQFPAYTGLAAREVEGTGDIHALEGTKVTLYALANHDIASAQVDFNADGRHDLAMTADKAKASAQFTLNLGEDRRTPEFDRYVLQYKTTNGRVSSLPPTYTIDVTPDYAPEIRITAPVDDEGKLVEQLDVPLDSQFTVEVEARDPDFALANVVVLGESAGEQVLRHDLLTQSQSGKFVGRMTATPAELGLKPGDVLEYWGAAVDNRQPEPNTAQTERLRIRVLGPPQFGNQQGQGEQPQGGGEGESGEQNGGGESGEQGEGLSGAGESGGESDEQGGEGGAGGAGEQSGENQSKGEQQGQGGQGGGQGENSDSQESQGADGEPASAGGDQQQGEQQQNGEQQGEQQNDPNAQSGDNSQGGDASQGDASQGKPGGQGKVSTEGDDDAEAFDRMNQHFAEDESQSEGQEGEEQEGEGQQSEGDSKGQQGDGQQSEAQSGQSEGEGKPDSDQSSKGESTEDAQPQEGGTEGPQEGEQSEGAGAEGQPSEQQNPQEGDPEKGEPASAGGGKSEEQQSPNGEMSPEQGEQGAGNNPGEEQGSPDSPDGRKPKDKEGQQSPDSQENDQEAPAQGQGNKESDSQGGQGGDRAGGGQEGAGQQADSEGTGTAGENTAADEGAGQAEESGTGENSSKAGQDAESDKPTGKPGENQAGDGSKQSDQQSGSKPGGEQQGAQGGEGEQKPGESPPAEGEQGQQPGESQPSGDPQAGGQQQGEQPPGESEPNDNPGQQPPGAGTGSNNASGQPPGEVEPGDAANLDYAKKQTDLVLDKLDDQLKKSDVDKELLDKLGWTEEELRQFVSRWKKLKAEAAIAPEEKQHELDDALRSLGIDRTRRTGFQSQAVKEKLRDLKDSYRGQTPLEYADQVRAYIKGTATVPEEKKE